MAFRLGSWAFNRRCEFRRKSFWRDALLREINTSPRLIVAQCSLNSKAEVYEAFYVRWRGIEYFWSSFDAPQ